jgi:hypothetical protein
MGQITKVTPDMIQVANNVTSTTIGNTTSGISLTFDSNGVITSAANVVLSVANTQLTGTITNAQLGTDAVSNTKIAAGAVEQYFADTGFEAQFRNRIINGDMRIDQRNAGAAVTLTNSALTYPVDRFGGFDSTDATVTAQRDTTAPAGFTNSVKITVTAADASVGATQRATLQQRIEGFNVADFGWGTANAKPVTISFLVRSSVTGTFGGALQNNASDRSYPFTYSISVADTWETKSITVAGDTSGTWLTDNGTGLRIYFGFGVGSTYSGTAGAWGGGDYNSATGATDLVNTLDATWYVTGVQLEVGSVATPFERRPFGAELALCQRYACSSFPLGTAWGQNAGTAGAFSYIVLVGGTSAGFGISMPFPVTMRANPTLTYYNPSAANDKWRNTIANADSASGAGVNIRAWGTQITNYQVAGDVASQTCQVHWSVTAEL